MSYYDKLCDARDALNALRELTEMIDTDKWEHLSESIYPIFPFISGQIAHLCNLVDESSIDLALYNADSDLMSRIAWLEAAAAEEKKKLDAEELADWKRSQ